MTSRREFLEQSVFALVGAGSLDRFSNRRQATGSLNVRAPDALAVQTANEVRQLRAIGAGRWEGAGVAVSTVDAGDVLRVQLAAPAVGVRRIHLRWNDRLDDIRLILGDAWERGYGDLEWRGFVPD